MMENNISEEPNQPKKQNLWSIVVDRLGLDSLAYRVPEYANSLPYLLGGTTAFSFIVLIASGIFLAQFYNPNPLYAHESVVYIITKVPFGDFIRSIHYWSSNLVMILIVLHATRVFITASYKRPREITWFSGLFLLGVTLFFIFTGTILKSDQEAFEALGHNQELAGFFGKAGTFFTPGFTHSVPLLTRIYDAHSTILVLTLVIILFIHFFLIKKHGISQKAVQGAVSKATAGIGESYFYLHIKKLLGYGFLFVAAVSLVSLIFPAPLGQPGVVGMELTKPPWMFLPFYALENVFGIQALIWGPLVLFLLLALVPILDRSPWVSPKQRKMVIVFGAIVFTLLIALTLFAWFAPVKNHLGGEGMKDKKTIFALLHISKFPMVSGAYAHGMSTINVTPITTEAGGKIIVKGDGLKSEMTYTLVLDGLQSTITLGTVTVEKGEDHVDAEFILPPSLKPDLFQVKAVDSSGNAIFANDSLTVTNNNPNQNDEMGSAKALELARTKSPTELAVVFGIILFSLILGLLLIRRPLRR